MLAIDSKPRALTSAIAGDLDIIQALLHENGCAWQFARMRLPVVLGAFAGLRLAEECGLRVEDVDFLRAFVYPKVQYPTRPLTSKTSRTEQGRNTAVAL